MTKQKSTKRALLLSVLSLLMCVSMLIGTTFAWFTDSVTSAGNIIKAGTLDVTMEWADGTKAVPAVDSTDWKDASADAIFNYDLWEPGYTEVRHIKIANEGTLALKYQLNIVANGEVSKLADVIDVYYVDPAVQVADRAALTADKRLGTLSEVLDEVDTTASGKLLAGDMCTVTLALKMQESAGNEYKGLAIGTDFSVKLSAIQLNYEDDSFGPDYDEGLDPETTYVSTFAELKNAARNGGKVALNSDLQITDKSEFFYGSYVTAVYNDMILDLNGHTITIDVPADKVADAPVLFYVYSEGASLTIVGDGDVVAKNDAFLVFPRSVSEGVYIYGGNYYNIDETSGTKNDINAIVYSQTNSNIHIYGGTFTFKNVNGHCGAFNVYDNRGAEIILYEGVLLSNSNYYLGSDADEIHLAEGCVLDEVVIDGQTWYMVVKDGTNVVGSAEDFIAPEIEAGEKIEIVNDIVHNNTEPDKQMIMQTNAAIDFDGNGNTITVTGTDPSVGNHGYVSFVPPNGESATVSDLTVTGSGFVGLGYYTMSGKSTFEANNLVLKDIVSPLANINLGKTVGCAFMHYGKTATLNNCRMTGTTAMIDGVIPYDIGFGNSTETIVNGGEYGTARVWEHANVVINGAEIGSMDVALIKGNVTIKAGSHIGTINIDYGTYTQYDTAANLDRIVIEDGATVDAIVYHGTTYTLAEWLAR